MSKSENRRYRRLNLDDKMEILKTLDSRLYTQTQICQMFSTSKSTISKIQSNRRNLREKFEQSNCEDEEYVESKLLDWMAKCRLSKTAVCAASVMEKARAFGQELGVDFDANVRWLKQFLQSRAIELDDSSQCDTPSQRETESTDKFRCVTCNAEFVSEVELQKHKLTHIPSYGLEAASMNGNINNDSQSFADDSFGTAEQNSNDKDAELSATLSGLEAKLSDEKIIADDFLMNVGNDGNSFEIVDDDQFPFSINDDEPLPEPYMDDDSNDNVAAGEGEHENDGDGDDDDDENEADAGEDNHMNNDSMSTLLGGESNTSENASESDRMSENEQETAEEAPARPSGDDIPQEASSSAAESSSAAIQSETNDQSETENVDQPASSSDAPCEDAVSGGDREKENEKEDDLESTEARRPSSRESVTSTASSSSERTLIIRSASEVNKIVADSSDVVVKTERVVSDRPAISILNPDQLGATSSGGGENFLNSAAYGQPADPMMGYLTPGLQDGPAPLQCDVCETTFADGLILEEHRASAGHYKCHCSPECASYVFQTVAELSSHQQTLHGIMSQSPVQQLQHQVQNLRYQMEQPVGNNYQTMPQYQSGAVAQSRSVVPSMYPNSHGSPQLRQYAPRIQPNSVRGAVPMGNQASLKRSPAPIQPQRFPPPKRRCPDNFLTRNGDADCKVVSIQKPDNCDDVVAQLSKSITITARQENQKMNETAAVANMLANRGITVSSVPTKQNRTPNPVAMLNLNSAVSLIPTNNNKNSSFAVPQGRISSGRPVASPVPGRMQTVDLTGPDPPRNKLMNRPPNRFTCQICDRTFFNQDQLNQHLITHRSSPRKQLPFRCNVCSAQYPTQQSLMQHRQTCRRDAVSSTNEMVIPIVDLKQPGALQRLQSIGINYMIPLNALGSQSSNGTFGIPILPFSSDRNTINNMTNCGISNILPVGPLKALSR